MLESNRKLLLSSQKHYPFIHHSLRCLYYERSVGSYKSSSPQGVIWCHMFQFWVFSGFINIIQELLTSSASSSCHFYLNLYLFFDNVFWKKVPTQDATNRVSLRPFSCTTFLSSLTLCNECVYLVINTTRWLP